jgi:hypothetical protein
MLEGWCFENDNLSIEQRSMKAGYPSMASLDLLLLVTLRIVVPFRNRSPVNNPVMIPRTDADLHSNRPTFHKIMTAYALIT